jgi:hypothetical protein
MLVGWKRWKKFVPTVDPEKVHAAFIDGGEEFVNRSPDQREVRLCAKSKRRRVC